MNRRIAALISGRGSNLQSMIDAIATQRLDATLAVVISNRSDAPGLLRAREAGIEARRIGARDYPDRDVCDRAIVDILRARGVGLVCLAGYMRLVGPRLLEAQRQALDHGVRVSGATVHLVTAGLDDGPIILQAAVPVLDDDTAETLSARILIAEHRIYPEAIQIALDGEWSVNGRRFVRTRPAGA